MARTEAPRTLRRLRTAALTVVAVAVVATGAFVAWAWAPDLPVEALAPRWAPSPSTFVTVEGLRVHVRDEGARTDPVPVVLLHGTSASLHTWDGWVAALAPARRVIRMDLPGFGLSDGFPSGDYGVPRYVAFLRRLLDQLGVSRAIVAGNSLGGQLA